MSLFGSLMPDFDDDPIFGSHMRSMRQMNSMVNSMFNHSFGGMMGGGMNGGFPALTSGPSTRSENSLMPFGDGFGSGGFMNLNRLLCGSLDSMANNGNCQTFMSSSVVQMSHGPDGRPLVYRESKTAKTGPGGIRETQHSLQDSRTGTKKMTIGHHIYDRGHVLEREENTHTGDKEEREEFINLDEEEAEEFNREFETKARRNVANTTRTQLAIGEPSRKILQLTATPHNDSLIPSHRRARDSRTTQQINRLTSTTSPLSRRNRSSPLTSLSSPVSIRNPPYSTGQTHKSDKKKGYKSILKSISGSHKTGANSKS